MTGHPTVDVVIDGLPIPIDIDIAPLVDLINRAGIRTTDSCQETDEHERAEISFDSADGAANFLNVVAVEPGTHLTGLWNRITDTHEPDDFDPWQIWSYDAGPIDRAATWEYDGTTYTAVRWRHQTLPSG